LAAPHRFNSCKAKSKSAIDYSPEEICKMVKTMKQNKLTTKVSRKQRAIKPNHLISKVAVVRNQQFADP